MERTDTKKRIKHTPIIFVVVMENRRRNAGRPEYVFSSKLNIVSLSIMIVIVSD